MSLTKDGCTMGLAWRRRGYILVEKGALDAAEDAYNKSLQCDATNRIAKNELAAIASMRRERTARTPDPPVTSVPNFGLTVTECSGAPSP
jgi:predicted TPR repeat methyltransferase